MKKRRILFVIHQLNHGGVQKALLSALNVINYNDNEVTLYIRKDRVQLLSEVNRNVKQIVVNQDKTHYYRRPYVVFLLFCKLFSKSERIQKRLVTYINTAQMKTEYKRYLSSLGKFDVAISYVQGYTARCVAEYVNADKKFMFFHGSTDETHELHEEVMPYFDRIVGVNENVRDILRELYPAVANRMTYIDNYVDAEEVRKKSLLFTADRPENKIVLCSCGRFAAVKGFDLAVEAAGILKERGIRFLWYFVGDGPERPKLEQKIAEYGLEDCIRITGMQENPYPYIGCCDVYVQPSYEEAQPLTIIEAQILSKPIVTTATVGGKSLVKHMVNGLHSEITAEDLAEKMIHILGDADLRQKITEYLKKTDYAEDFHKYQTAWSRLLEE